MKTKIAIAAIATMFGGVLSAATHTITLSSDMTLAEALNTVSLTESSLNGGANKADDLVFKVADASVSHKVTFSSALASWTGNLTAESGVIVYAVSDNTSYATVLGAAVSGTTTNGIIKIKDGATLQVRTNSSSNENCLNRPIHVTGNGVDGKGALRLSSTTNIRAMYPRYIHLDGDTLLTRLDSDSMLNGGTVWTYTRYLYMNNHVLTLSKANAGMQLIWESTRIFTGGKSAGLIVGNDCIFVFRDNSWDGDSNNFVKATGSGKIAIQNGFGPKSGWQLIYDTTSTFDPGAYSSWWTFDNTATYRCWQGPTVLNKRIFNTENSTNSYQLGFHGKVSGEGGINFGTSVSNLGKKHFHLYSGENDFTGGLTMTGYLLRLGSPTAVPSGTGNGGMTLNNSEIDLNYDLSVGDFVFPETTFAGSGKLYSRNYVDANAKHRGKFQNLTKTGTGTFAIDAHLTGGNLNVKGGTVKLAKVAKTEQEMRAEVAGFKWGWLKSTEGYSDKGDMNGIPITNTYFTNMNWYAELRTNGGTTLKPAVFNTEIGTDYCNTYYHKVYVYHGYLWNDTEQAKTLRVITTICSYLSLEVNGKTILGIEIPRVPNRNTATANQLKYKEMSITLQPGANAFAIRVYDRFAAGGTWLYGNLCHSGLTNWDDVHGLMWTEKADTLDMNDFQEFADPGDGSFITREKIEPVEDLDYQTVDSISGSGTIDLDGSVLKVKEVDFSGGLQITNGTLQLMSTITNGSSAIDVSAMSGSVKVNVDQDANKRRADCIGMWYGEAVAQNSNSNKQHYTTKFWDNALEDKAADFYMAYYTNSVVTEMAPMTHVTTWPPEGPEYASQWIDTGATTAADPFWRTDPRVYKSWSGCVWNDSPTNEIWTAINCNNAYVDLRLNGSQCYKYTATDNRGFGTYSGQNGYSRNTYTAKTGKFGVAAVKTQIMVAPGPNELKVRYWSRWDCCRYWPGATETNVNGAVFTKWSEGHGLVFDRKGRGTTDIDNYEDFKDTTGQVITRELPDEFPFIKGEGATINLSGKETAAGMLIGHVKATSAMLVVDGVWTLTGEQVKGGVSSNGLQFNGYSRLIITGVTMAELVDDMPGGGYLLATNCRGVPKLVGADGTSLKVVNRGGSIYLISGRGGFYIHYK